MADHNITTQKTPEEIEIQEKTLELSRLSEELAQKEMDLEDAKLSLRQFQRRYYNTVGRKYVVLDDLLAQIAELTAAKHPYDQKAKAARHRPAARQKSQHGNSIVVSRMRFQLPRPPRHQMRANRCIDKSHPSFTPTKRLMMKQKKYARGSWRN